MVASKIKRPRNLSKWVFFGQSHLSREENLLGASASYVQKVRKENKPVIYVHELGKHKYRWEVGIDLVEGFKESRIRLTPDFANYVYEILIGPASVKKGYGSINAIQSFGFARYASLDDAVTVANKLANLPESAFIFPDRERQKE